MNLIQPVSFGHGRFIAASIQMAPSAKEKSGDELKPILERWLNEEFPFDAIEDTKDANVIWEYLALRSVALTFCMTSARQSSNEPDDDFQRMARKLVWRSAELDPVGGTSYNPLGSADAIVPESLAIAMGRAAASAGRTGELMDLVTEPPRPGVVCYKERDVRIRSMNLTSDWPSELPAVLMQRKTNSRHKAKSGDESC